MIKYSPDELLDKFRSKKDLYRRLTSDSQYFLPSYKMTPISFIKDIFSGKKNVFKIDKIKKIHVPFYEELSVTKVYPVLKDKLPLKFYLPDYPDGKMPERFFFYSILSTLYPQQVKEMVAKAREHRSIKEVSDENEQIH